MGSDIRLGIFDENGEGEAVGCIVVMRFVENADKVIRALKVKMKEVNKGSPEGITSKIAYDRSTLIKAAIETIKGKLFEEIICISLIVKNGSSVLKLHFL